MFRVFLFAIFLFEYIVSTAQIIPADSIYCDSIVKADENYVKFYNDRSYFGNGLLKSEALILRKRLNAEYDIDIPVGRISEFYRNGDLKQVYYHDYKGRPCGSDTMCYVSGVIKKVMIYDSVNTYYSKNEYMSSSFNPDNYYVRKFYQNGFPRTEGRLFISEKQMTRERRGKWVFYNKDGSVRKVKMYN